MHRQFLIVVVFFFSSESQNYKNFVFYNMGQHTNHLKARTHLTVIFDDLTFEMMNT